MSEWVGHPSIVLGLAGLLAAYVFAARQRASRIRGQPVTTRQVTLFGVGLLVIYVALASPLHDLSERYLFTAHMVQHLLLTLVAPPLVLLGIPGWMIASLVRWRAVRDVAAWLTQPLIAFALFNVAFAASHLPALYELTLDNHGAHIVEHLIFMGTAVLMWWPILSPLTV